MIHRRHPRVVCFTGLSGAGKTTIARLVEARLVEHGHRVFVLDGDALREGLCRDLTFSLADRSENLPRAADVAADVASEGFTVLSTFIMPPQIDRERIGARLVSITFPEVFVDTALDVAEQRDPKGSINRFALNYEAALRASNGQAAKFSRSRTSSCRRLTDVPQR